MDWWFPLCFSTFPIFSQHSVGNYGGARGEGSLVLQDAAYGIGATLDSMGKTSQCLTLQVLDRRMDMNPNYEEATMALNFNPEDMGASPPSERQAWIFLLGRCGRLSWVVNAHGNALRTNPDLQKIQNEELGGLGDQDQSAGSAVCHQFIFRSWTLLL